MSLANCPRCKKVFNRVSGIALCEACRAREDEDFDTCYRFLREHPHATIPEISEATEVDEVRILDFYRAGRLIVGEAGYPCKRCGGPTQRGTYCDRCVDNLKTGLDAETSKPIPPATGTLGLPHDTASRRSWIDRR